MATQNISMTMMEREWGIAPVYLLATLLAIFIVIASIGNLLVMISIIVTRHQCDRGYIFLFNLALIDFLTSVCLMPLALVTLLNGDFIFSHAVCEFNGFSLEVLFIASIHNLMYMAVYRYMVVSNPFRPVHMAKIGVMITACWLWSFIVSGLSWRLLNHFLYKMFTTQCGPEYPADLAGWLNVGIVASTCFSMPLIVIVTLYILLFRKAHQLFKRLGDPEYSNYSEEAHSEQRKMSITFIIIVVAFIICWSPLFGYLHYASIIKDKDDIPTLFNPIGNSANFILKSDSNKLQIKYDTSDKTTSVIYFQCSSKAEEGVSFLRKDSSSEKTIYYFQYSTALACEGVESVPCTLSLTDKNYDLSSLTRHTGNFESHKYSGEIFYMNFCHRVIADGDAAQCPRGSAACMKKDNKYVSLGRLEADKSPVYQLGNDIAIHYTNGDDCLAEHGTKYSMIIHLTCNEKKVVGGEIDPRGFSGDEPCRYDFLYETAAACPVTSDPHQTTATCGQIDGFDTDPLKKQYNISSSEHQYIINFCGASGSQKTCNGASDFGVCQILGDGTEVLAGKPTNSAKYINDDKLVFNFTDGVTCAHDPLKRPRNVELTIFCGPDSGVDSQPLFIGESTQDCTYSIYWHRKELCRKETVPCTVAVDDHIVDLSELSEAVFHANTEAALPASLRPYSYLISVCKPLPEENNPCPGAGICKVSEDGTVHGQDLGFLHESPKAIGSDGHIELHYSTQIKCADPSKTISSVILFTCGPHRGIPRLISSDNCTYIFEWETSQACRDEGDIKPLSNCEAQHFLTGQKIDLKLFSGKDYSVKDGGTNYQINVCASLPSESLGSCAAGSAVCKDKTTSLGLSADSTYQLQDNNVIVTYRGGKACRNVEDEDSKSYTEIHFICDRSKGEGHPTLVAGADSCKTYLEWRTSYVCVSDCVLEDGGYTYEFRNLDPHFKSITIKHDDYTFTMRVCKSLPSDLGCGADTGICMQTGSSEKHPLALTTTQTAEMWGKNVALKYQGAPGDQICTNVNMHPVVIIVLSCANGYGQPVFDSENKKNCTFNFKWATHAACKTADRLSVTLRQDGEFTDSLTKNVFSIKRAMHQRVNITDGTFYYAMSLSDPLSDDEILSPNCTDGNTRVCQYEPQGDLRRRIGTKIDKTYFGDGELQMVLVSDSECGRYKKHNVTTLINFKCNPQASNASKPIHFSETESCQHVFEWELPSLCSPVTASGGSNSPNGKGGLSPGVTAIIVIIVLISVVGTTVLVVVKLRRRRRWAGTYEYSGLSTDDDSSMLVSGRKDASPRFYDDDDDELII